MAPAPGTHLSHSTPPPAGAAALPPPRSRRRLSFACRWLLLASVLLAGCDNWWWRSRNSASQEQEILHPTNSESRTLSLHRIDDPYSDRGQSLIRKQRKMREQLEAAIQRHNDRVAAVRGEPAAEDSLLRRMDLDRTASGRIQGQSASTGSVKFVD